MDKLGITFHFPSLNGLFAEGALAALGHFMSYFFILLTVIWIGYSIYAAYKIILSQGGEKDMQTGYTLIKNVWVSISWGMVFFIIISIIGTFAGIGNVTQWYYQLAQCNSAAGGFYFKDVATAETVGTPTTAFYCCKVGNLKNASGAYADLGFEEGSYHFIGSSSSTSAPSSSAFTECELFQ